MKKNIIQNEPQPIQKIDKSILNKVPTVQKSTDKRGSTGKSKKENGECLVY